MLRRWPPPPRSTAPLRQQAIPAKPTLRRSTTGNGNGRDRSSSYAIRNHTTVHGNVLKGKRSLRPLKSYFRQVPKASASVTTSASVNPLSRPCKHRTCPHVSFLPQTAPANRTRDENVSTSNKLVRWSDGPVRFLPYSRDKRGTSPDQDARGPARDGFGPVTQQRPLEEQYYSSTHGCAQYPVKKPRELYQFIYLAINGADCHRRAHCAAGPQPSSKARLFLPVLSLSEARVPV